MSVIIGRAGSNIKAIQARFGVHINIPKEAGMGSMPRMRTMEITGLNMPLCEAARAEVFAALSKDDVAARGSGGGGGGGGGVGGSSVGGASGPVTVMYIPRTA